MEYIYNTIESLKLKNIRLDSVVKKEESYIWKNMIRIEQLKKEKLRKKDALLRKNLQA